MKLNLSTVVLVAKGLSMKRQKANDETEHVIAHLRFTDATISRDEMDEIIGIQIGSTALLFDEQGAPVARLRLGLDGRELTLSGKVQHNEDSKTSLELVDADLKGISIHLQKLGGLLCGTVSWRVRGDEAEDCEALLGQQCTVKWRLQDSGQQDLLAGAARKLVDTVSGLGGGTLSAGGKTVRIRDSQRQSRGRPRKGRK